MRIFDALVSATLGLSLAGCSIDSDLGGLAAALKTPDAGPATDAGPVCIPQLFNQLWGYELGVDYPVEGAYFLEAGSRDIPTLGPGVTVVLRPLSEDRWIYLSFGGPVVDGNVPRALGWPSCAVVDSRLFSPELPDGGFYQSELKASIHVNAAGISPGDKIDLLIDDASYVDPTGATISLPEIHIVEKLPTIPDGG